MEMNARATRATKAARERRQSLKKAKKEKKESKKYDDDDDKNDESRSFSSPREKDEGNREEEVSDRSRTTTRTSLAPRMGYESV